MKCLTGMITALVISFGAAGAFAGPLLGVDFDTGNLYQVSTSDAALTLVGNTGVTGWAEIEFAPNGTLYGFTSGVAATLFTINSTTAAVTPVGPLGTFVFEGGLAFAPNGTAFGTNMGDAGTPQLFTLNLTTGQGTTVGTISGGSHDINGLAFRSDGQLVGLDRVTNSLLLIDPTTAASSVLAALSPTVGALGGMTFDGTTGFFSTAGTGANVPGSNSLYSFDLFTGSFTLIGAFALTDSGISGLATQVPSAVPEPTTLSLLAGGIILLGGVWLRHGRQSGSGA